MATILRFDPVAAQARRPVPYDSALAVGSQGAELIFFPGIRYERHDDEPPHGSPCHGKRRANEGGGE